jgi:hypothetical protein
LAYYLEYQLNLEIKYWGFFHTMLRMKKAIKNNKFLMALSEKSAQDWIRTSTPFPAPPPQGGLSTNFNTWATDY